MDGGVGAAKLAARKAPFAGRQTERPAFELIFLANIFHFTVHHFIYSSRASTAHFASEKSTRVNNLILICCASSRDDTEQVEMVWLSIPL
jgi:hypothetical protein